MPKESEVDESTLVEVGSLAELAGCGGSGFEGELIKLEAIKGKKVTVLDYKYLPSQFDDGDDMNEYLSIQLEVDGDKCVVNTKAGAIARDFKNIPKEQLPGFITFDQKKGKAGRMYWYMR